jgi:hypothetical protein
MTILLSEPIDAYHAHAAVSNSKLKLFRSRGAYYYKVRYLDRANVVKDEDTPALKFGRFLDELMTDPNHYRDRWAVAPDIDGRSAEAKAWKKANEGKQTISFGEAAAALQMALGIETIRRPPS